MRKDNAWHLIDWGPKPRNKVSLRSTASQHYLNQLFLGTGFKAIRAIQIACLYNLTRETAFTVTQEMRWGDGLKA